ncbi:MAG: class I SAM-dependent methyltransferase [Actinomycetota bacterium]|jgi:hypothetical protein|nr:class I SAM-dependent methyltransferase [Actinomycetota bacterium]
MNLADYRSSPKEQERLTSLMELLPANAKTALDAGARDGFISRVLADSIESVTALDLETPEVDDARVHCVQGDITAMEFPDSSFDLVLCAQVLEHLPDEMLACACNELTRVSSQYLLIGVPFKQDLMAGRTTCQQCGGTNPPWGHVNSFDERRLLDLFPGCEFIRQSFAGSRGRGTNALACFLTDAAGNPNGTYEQEEPCVHCGAALGGPPTSDLLEKALLKAANFAKHTLTRSSALSSYWIHMLLEKRTT